MSSESSGRGCREQSEGGGGGGTGVELGAPGETVEHFLGRTRGGSGKTNTNNYFAVFESSTETELTSICRMLLSQSRERRGAHLVQGHGCGGGCSGL